MSKKHLKGRFDQTVEAEQSAFDKRFATAESLLLKPTESATAASPAPVSVSQAETGPSPAKVRKTAQGVSKATKPAKAVAEVAISDQPFIKDSFTLPESEHNDLTALLHAARVAGLWSATRSQIIRAALRQLQRLRDNPAELKKAVEEVERGSPGPKPGAKS